MDRERKDPGKVKDVPEKEGQPQKRPSSSRPAETPEDGSPGKAESAGAGGTSGTADSLSQPDEAGQGGAGPEEGAEGRDSGGSTGEEGAVAQDPASALKTLAGEKEQLEDQFLRLRADFDNFKKRVTKEKADIIQHGNEALLKDLLPVIDNIERILGYSLKEQNWKSLQEGIELVLSEMRKTLAQRGLEAIQAVGTSFDPNLHEAIQRTETEQASPNTVLEECQKGYLYRGRLLRPSQVVVAARPQRHEDGEQGAEPIEAAGDNSAKNEPIVN